MSDCSFEVEASLVDYILQSTAFEMSFHDRENTFYGVELGGIAHVEDRLDVQLRVVRFDYHSFVHG